MREGVRNHGLIHESRRTASLQTLAVLAAVLPILASLSFSFHETTVQHVRCAEHGELMHVARAAEEPSSAAAQSARHTPAAGPLEARSAAAHEHCAELSDCLGTEGSCARRTALQFAPPALRPCDATPAPRLSRARLLAAAPKTSPPRAG